MNLTEEDQRAVMLLKELEESGLLTYPIDFECCEPSQDAASETLGYWFDGADWKKRGYRFVQVGSDGGGSLFCLWFKESEVGNPTVVFFGSEGEVHVVAKSLSDFVRMLVSGKLFFDGSWLAPDDEEEPLDWDGMQKRVADAIGLPEKSPEALAAGQESQQAEFQDWVSKTLGHA